MRKIVIPRAGSYERLRVDNVPTPQAGSGEVRVRIEATGVNYADVLIRMGLYASAKEYVGWPITPGFEFAGVVEALGSDVLDGRFEVGQPVFGVSRFGAYAEAICVPAAQLFARPSTLTAVQAAALPTIFLTAYYAIHELVHPRPGRAFLVHSAAGGVGSMLVQLGRLASCRVVGVVGASHKVDALRALGADVVIDKSTEDLWSAAEAACPGGYDAVFDANGVATLRGSYRHLRPSGKLVIYGFHTMLPREGGRPKYLKLAKDYLLTPRFNPLDLTNDNKSVMAFNLSYLFEELELLHEGIATMLGHLADEALKLPRITTYPLEQVAQAHRDLESAQTVGKLVLTCP
jgi:NADPH:quinone reductase-like Zn-dependent oxidoreductase